jgi:hypothetical protein
VIRRQPRDEMINVLSAAGMRLAGEPAIDDDVHGQTLPSVHD